MEEQIKHYTRDGLTVIWKPAQCIHSTICWKGLIKVFNPRARPWINIEGADTERIIEQVKKCPSGALSYIQNAHTATPDGTIQDSSTSVEVLKNGPLMVYGNLRVKDSAGNEVVKSKVTAFCRCGASANKPYCDGSHMRIGFTDDRG
ncbi:hypothetical protein GCM10023093_15790 [Nemorincola caseinilytica]|uniref:Iron-binding zinc finger CDGSH type domain-containing protein n=1 Tax=Nemorincola caseinilytica TaxID=2054315 RepID=A0ABP8NBZ8_9BACT